MDQPALAGTSSETLEDIVGAEFYCPHALADSNQHVRTTERMLEFSSTELSKLSMYLENNPPVSSFVDAPTHVGRHKHTYAIEI